MKANLIIKLVEAHCSGTETNFESALFELIQDEERKGNVPLASSLRTAYQPGNIQAVKPCEGGTFSGGFIQQGLQTPVAPKDKDSMLDLYDIVHTDLRLDDVVLPQKQKEVLSQIIDEQRHSDQLLSKGIFPANRLLLCGPPGCGKTMTAHAVASELGLPMAYVRLDGLVSSYLGQTSTNLRKVFDSVRNRRMILFLDEFDAIAKKRDDAHELGELKRVVTTLLQNFDTIPPHVFLIAATNHEHLLDPAIWRRFNTAISLGLPEVEQRAVLLDKWLHDYNIERNLDCGLLAKATEGMNCAQIKELVVSTAKRALIGKDAFAEVRTLDVIAVLLQQMSMYSQDSMEVFTSILRRLKDSGVALRTLEEITGIPKSTLSYRLKKEVING
ncbi:MAG: AAA family ATPase [Armatimonadota bacterium]